MRDKSVQAGRETLDLGGPVGQQRRRRHQQLAVADRSSPSCAPATARVPGWSCPGPCRRRGRRQTQFPTGGVASARRLLIRAQVRAERGRARRRPGPRLAQSLEQFGSHGPATTRDQSWSASVTTSSSAVSAPDSRRMASQRSSQPRQQAAPPAYCCIIASRRSRSISTQRPRTMQRPLVASRSWRSSVSVKASPSSLTCMRKSSRASLPRDYRLGADDGCDLGPGRAVAFQPAGMRSTTPALSKAAASPSSRNASSGVQRKGWKISPRRHLAQPRAGFRPPVAPAVATTADAACWTHPRIRAGPDREAGAGPCRGSTDDWCRSTETRTGHPDPCDSRPG